MVGSRIARSLFVSGRAITRKLKGSKTNKEWSKTTVAYKTNGMRDAVSYGTTGVERSDVVGASLVSERLMTYPWEHVSLRLMA